MTNAERPQGPLSEIAQLAGRPLGEIYRLFRLEGAPSPVGHVSQINVYDLDEAMAWLHPSDHVPQREESLPESLDLTPKRPPRVV